MTGDTFSTTCYSLTLSPRGRRCWSTATPTAFGRSPHLPICRQTPVELTSRPGHFLSHAQFLFLSCLGALPAEGAAEEGSDQVAQQQMLARVLEAIPKKPRRRTASTAHSGAAAEAAAEAAAATTVTWRTCRPQWVVRLLGDDLEESPAMDLPGGGLLGSDTR